MAKATNAELQGVVSKLAITRGVVSILFGIVALVWPGLTLATLALLLALWLLIGGTVKLVSSVVSRKSSPHWVLGMIVGLLGLGVGAYLVQRPGLTVATVVALTAIVLLVEGVVDVVMSIVDNDMDHRVFAAIAGVLGIVAGVVIWRYPVTGSLAFVWVLGLYSVVMGALSIAAGAEMND